jgi:hypothetical protein
VIVGRNAANSADRNLVRWGVTNNDVATFGDALTVTEVLGTSVQLSGSYLEVTTLGTRNVVALGRGAPITATQVPTAMNGTSLVYLADSSSSPGWGSGTGPVSGSIFWNSATLGMIGKSQQRSETTIIPDGGNDSRLRKFIGTKVAQSYTASGAGAQQQVVFLDCANINGAGNLNQKAVFHVRLAMVAIEGTGIAGYAYVSSFEACVELTSAGVLAIKGAVLSNPGTYGSVSNQPTVTIMTSGTTIMGVITLANSGTTPLHCFGVLEIMGMTYL